MHACRCGYIQRTDMTGKITYGIFTSFCPAFVFNLGEVTGDEGVVLEDNLSYLELMRQELHSERMMRHLSCVGGRGNPPPG
jgi:hypothetical protein